MLWLGFAFGYLGGELLAGRFMYPNELGDFLAGASAPLAFLWLVLGYFQQGEELRQNTQALTLQTEEMATLARNTEVQAQATEQLVALSQDNQEKEAAKLILDAQPEFVIKRAHSSSFENIYEVLNVGGRASELKVTCDGSHTFRVKPDDVLLPDQTVHLWLNLTIGHEFPIAFTIEYTDKFNRRYSRGFKLVDIRTVRQAGNLVELARPD